ncbi:MAG: hypothetical protein U0792_01815 [Gemmataceae bacterium]
MTDERKRVLDLLGELSTLHPDMRMGQWLLMFAELARGATPEAIYDVEDEDLIPVMQAFLDKRLAEATHPATA